jgi:hypothetical protein
MTALLLALLLAAPLIAEAPDGEVPAPRPRLLDADETMEPEPRRPRLLKPQIPVIAPRGGAGKAEAEQKLPLYGQGLTDQQAVFLPAENGWPKLQLTSKRPDRVPDEVILLPNSLREAIEQAAEQTEDEFFRVSGELTVYDGQVYLLVTRAVMVQPADADNAPSTDPDPTDPTGQTDAPEGDPSARPGRQGQGADPVAPEEIIEKLFEDGRITPMLSETSSEPAEPTETGLGPVRHKELIFNRAVRISPRGDGFEIRFVGDNNRGEKPLAILPSRLLGRALEMTTPPLRTETLLISGQLTRYKGAGYVLLRKVLPRRDLGT